MSEEGLVHIGFYSVFDGVYYSVYSWISKYSNIEIKVTVYKRGELDIDLFIDNGRDRMDAPLRHIKTLKQLENLTKALESEE